ncbi:hypothetical protein N8D56_25060 (plasmid) [Devosia sp. A8/3-2]|nr:hypothetical protein N8D56_25060 [Devosia sp. A8/3-2]
MTIVAKFDPLHLYSPLSCYHANIRFKTKRDFRADPTGKLNVDLSKSARAGKPVAPVEVYLADADPLVGEQAQSR